MAKIQSQSTSNPNSIAQWAAVEALSGPLDFMENNLEHFAARRTLVSDALNAIDGIVFYQKAPSMFIPILQG